jgi:hypothetical protein
MKTNVTEAKAMCLLCGDVISSCTEYAEASCGCGAIGVIGGPELIYRGREKHIMILEAESPISDTASGKITCPHCGGKF